MCRDCGCAIPKGQNHSHGDDDHLHDHRQSHGHHHSSEQNYSALEEKDLRPNDLLISLRQANDEIAQANRLWLHNHNITAYNIISSPGSGKTFLLEKTIIALKNDLSLVVLVGDQYTQNDARRLQKTGVPVKQINTNSNCHLDALMIAKELNDFVHDLAPDILLIENVGNLVCPSAFDLGETAKVAILSTTEGEDKPQKYPLLFREASAIVITKMDLVPHLDWNLPKTIENMRRLNSRAPIFALSAKTDEGMVDWLAWLSKGLRPELDVERRSPLNHKQLVP
jgi:hydrogenase nickel incorporation protein HypB